MNYVDSMRETNRNALHFSIFIGINIKIPQKRTGMEESPTRSKSFENALGIRIHPGETGDFSFQKRLYDQIVAPRESDLETSFGRVRNFVDDIMYEAQARVWYETPATTRKDFQNKDSSPLFGYPDGCCLMIVEKTLGILYGVLDDEAPYLREFAERGGVVQKRWGYYRTSEGRDFLQNFIQIGDRIWDVAFEEMEPGENRKIHVDLVESGKYRNFRSLSELVSVTERYYPGTKYFPSSELLGWVGTFHSNVCFHESTGYLMSAGGNLDFGFDEVSEYLAESPPFVPDPETEERMIRAVTDLLAFESANMERIETFFLEEILFHLQKPVGSRQSLSTYLSHAKNFMDRQAENLEISPGEVFLELSEIVDRAMAHISDEYYDRLHSERVSAGLVDGKRNA